MNPIYDGYCQFLKDKTGIVLKEGFYWLDNSIIKAFDKQGNLHKLYRIIINDDLTASYKVPSNYDSEKDFEIASWNDIVEMNIEHLKELEEQSLNMIDEKMQKYHDYIPIIPVSMGKDSQVTCHLVRMKYPDTKAIFNNTTLDCADAYRMAKTFPNCEIMNPKSGFYQFVDKYDYIPTRFSRFCCQIFKTGEMVKRLDKNECYAIFMGIRNEESNTRKDYGDETKNPEWGNADWIELLPIRKWSELDVWLYTFWRNIQVNPKYKKGYSRVGCNIACPYYTKTTWVLDAYWFPKQRERWENILRNKFIKANKWIIMNCTIDEYVQKAWNGGVYRDEPTQEVIDEFAKYNGLSDSRENIAARYFNKTCANNCKQTRRGTPRKIKDKETLSMNLKLNGRNTTQFYCKDCLMKKYNLDDEKWNMLVRNFKRDGCALFNDTADNIETEMLDGGIET